MEQPRRGLTKIGPLLAINNPMRVRMSDGRKETFNAESGGSGRTIRWDNKMAAERRANAVRNMGFTARVKNNVVYVGPPKKGLKMPPRAKYDWAGTQGMSQKDLMLDY